MPSLNYQSRFALPVFLGLREHELHVKGAERDTEPWGDMKLHDQLAGKAKPKRQTIRRYGKWQWKPGDKAVMMAGGYNASRRKIGTVKITEVWGIKLCVAEVILESRDERKVLTGAAELDAFAADDGVASYTDMVRWFAFEYGAANQYQFFSGQLLKW